MASKIERLRAFARRRAEQGREMVRQVVTDLETSGAAAAMGYARGRFGDAQLTFWGIDVEVPIVLAVKLTAYSNMLGRSASRDLHALGNGVAAEYAALHALQLGDEHREQDRGRFLPRAVQGRGAMGPRGVGIPQQARQRQAA